MFGRVRASSSSLDTLDRPPSKIFKDDPLSIYEATLIKLKLGSQRDLSSPSEEAVDMESDCSTANISTSYMEPIFCTSKNVSESSLHVISPAEEAMTMDNNSSSATVLSVSSPSACQSSADSKQLRDRNISLLYLFSKYQSSRNALSSSDGESMAIESHVSANTFPSSSNCQSHGSTKEQSEHECQSSSSGFHI